jgi:hypothetical protein
MSVSFLEEKYHDCQIFKTCQVYHHKIEIPPIKLINFKRMHWDVKTVKPLDNYQLYVEIKDWRCGIFDVKPYLDFGVFHELKNIHYFNQVDILFGAITWPNEQDIASETLLANLLPLK